MKKTNYINLKYKPDLKNEILAEYYVESTLPIKQIAVEVAKESSIGTWTKLAALESKYFNKLAPQVYSIDSRKKIIKMLSQPPQWNKSYLFVR